MRLEIDQSTLYTREKAYFAERCWYVQRNFHPPVSIYVYYFLNRSVQPRQVTRPKKPLDFSCELDAWLVLSLAFVQQVVGPLVLRLF
jgi:hypothetical protein